MSEGIPHDVIDFVCSACGAGTWLTIEEAAHCAGTQMRCLKCGRDIDIPHRGPRVSEPSPWENSAREHSPSDQSAREQSLKQRRPNDILQQSQYELTVLSAVHVAPVARSHGGSPRAPADSLRALPGSLRRDPQLDDHAPPDRGSAEQVIETFATEDSGELTALADRGQRDANPAPKRLDRKKNKRKKKDKRPVENPLAPVEVHSETIIERNKRGVWFNSDDLLPAALAVGSLVVYAVIAANTVPRGLDSSNYLWHKLGFIVTVIAICTPVLLAASALMGICFGELKTVLLKIPAIVLTQGCAEDLLMMQPLPYLPTFGAWAVTLFLVMNAFDLEGLEAQLSMCLVRGIYSAVYWSLFVGMLTPPNLPAAQNWLFQPELKEDLAPKEPPVDNQNKAKEKAAGNRNESKPGKSGKEPRPVPQQRTADERSLTLTQEFGDALVAQDYERAHALMSRDYQGRVTLAAFSAIHRQALVDYGKPLKAEAGLGDTDEVSLTGAEFNRFRDVPPEDRFAWTYANLALELDRGETVRCYDCWLMLVQTEGELRVGAFEYGACTSD